MVGGHEDSLECRVFLLDELELISIGEQFNNDVAFADELQVATIFDKYVHVRLLGAGYVRARAEMSAGMVSGERVDWSIRYMFLPTSSLVALVAVFSYGIVTLLLSAGINRRAYNYIPGECHAVGNFEHRISDMETNSHGVVFLTTNGVSHTIDDFATRNKTPSSIFVYDSDNKTIQQLSIKNYRHPLHLGGVSIIPDLKRTTLLAVNEARSSVEFFDFDGKKNELRAVRTVIQKELGNVKDIAGVNRSSFFATTHNYDHPFLQFVETFSTLRLGSIVFFDGSRLHELDSIATPYGIVYDNFRRLLFVASYSSESIAVYKVHTGYNITKIKDVFLQTSPTRLWMDIEGSLIVVTHPVKLRHYHLTRHPSDGHSPTHILKLHLRPDDKESRVTSLYSNDGASVSGPTAAIRTGKKILIGSMRGLLSCEIDHMYTTREDDNKK